MPYCWISSPGSFVWRDDGKPYAVYVPKTIWYQHYIHNKIREKRTGTAERNGAARRTKDMVDGGLDESATESKHSQPSTPSLAHVGKAISSLALVALRFSPSFRLKSFAINIALLIGFRRLLSPLELGPHSG